MSKSFCALGCKPAQKLFMFPSQKHDLTRRKIWLDYFDMEEPNTAAVYACEKHFSDLQISSKGIRNGAVPDIPIICNATVHPFKRKPKNWRSNVIVVTPRDPEFTIYRHETGIFPQDLFNNNEPSQPVIQTPVINKISCSMSSQTCTRLCGLVEISDIREEYRLNCFYCSEMFPIEKWSLFVEHLRTTHFEAEEAFNMSKYVSQDHDYTSIPSSSVKATVRSPISTKMAGKSVPNRPPPVLRNPYRLPPLWAKPIRYITVPKKSEIKPPPLFSKPQQSHNTTTSFNVSAADQLIKLLSETLLSPKFLCTEEDNIVIIKNNESDGVETSSFLKNLVECQGEFPSPPKKTKSNIVSKAPALATSDSMPTRPVYTINNGLQDIPSRRNSMSHLLFPALPKSKTSKLIQRKIAQRALKNIDVFENIYKTVKKRYPNVVEIAYPKDHNTNKAANQQNSKSTPLSRCLKRTISEATEVVKEGPKVSTEIVFEYTPKDIVLSLLDNMKNYPVLWQFHDEPFNKDYRRAIEELCRIINTKWSLKITLPKMKRSVHRILRFYRFMSPCDEMNEFDDYFYKCTLFLPSSVGAIPRARCVYCSVCFEKDSDLRKHVIVRHKAIKWHFRCQTCFERFRERDEYELHKRLPHYEEKFKCELCKKIFNRRHLYNKHVASHQKSRERRLEAAKPDHLKLINHECGICNCKFISLSELNHHKRTRHKTPIMHKCHLCSKEFNLKSTLNIHLKRHNNELDFMCEVCGKGFVRKPYLEEHMKKHTGAKITCNICNLRLRKCNLLRHLRLVHIASEGTIESTFRAKCHHYQKYYRPYSKRRRTETPRRYNCKICQIHFDRLKHLKDHNKQAHFDIKRTACRLCPVEFIHLQNLKRHYRCKHKLHVYQIYLLVEKMEDPNKVLALKAEDLENTMPGMPLSWAKTSETNVSNENISADEIMRSDEIQDEIMKAVENLDKQEIQVDDDHSMNEFFTDLLK